MAMEKQKRLVHLLHKKTIRGEIDWREAVRGNAFQVALSDKTLRIRATPNAEEEGVIDYGIELLNSDGKVVDAFTDTELSNSEGVSISSWFHMMQEIHDMARRTALGSEKVLNEVLSELGGNDDQVPF